MSRHAHRRSEALLTLGLALIALPRRRKKGTHDRRVIGRRVEVGADGVRREFTLHATKGYRSSRA